MKLCFYSPYVPEHFGGGEKHLLDVAKTAALEHEVSVAVSSRKISADLSLHKIQSKYERFMGTPLDALTFIDTPLGSRDSAIQKLLWTGQFDGLYYVTDGSFFFTLARHNYLHIQTPLKIKLNTLQRLKMYFWQYKNTNSEFTKEFIEREWKTTVQQVLYPTVDVEMFRSSQDKEKIILNVGRFFRQLHSKRQDVLVLLFSKLLKKYPKETKGWKLLLIGAVEDESYFAEVKKLSKHLPVEFKTEVQREDLIECYKQASIYWHATGYDVNEIIHPEKVEHFGISTVEAMAAGAIPVTHFKGGQKEILGADLKELGWLTDEECLSITHNIISDKQLESQLRERVVQRSCRFGSPLFTKKVLQLFKK